MEAQPQMKVRKGPWAYSGEAGSFSGNFAQLGEAVGRMIFQIFSTMKTLQNSYFFKSWRLETVNVR